MENTMDDVTKRVGQNFEEIRDQVSERTQELRETIGNFVDEQPLAAVGIAFGVGYLLSGALFSRTTFKAATIGGKFVLGGFLKQLVGGIGPGILAAAMGSRGEGESQSHETQSQSKPRTRGTTGTTSGNGNGNKQ
jgi:hypothetical protein